MTREHRLLLSLDDIHAIRWVCGKCGVAVSYRLDESIKLLSECPACQHQLGAAAVADYHHLQAFVGALKLALQASRSKAIAATLQLEFVEDPEKAKG